MTNATATAKTLTKNETRTIAIGTKVFCTVHGCEGWTTILEVRQRDGYIKISGEKRWAPPFNFSLTDRNGRGWE